MKNVYACLLGEWVNLSNKENIIIDNSYNDANHWFREKNDTLFDYDYINIEIDNAHYRIHPSFIQVLTK
ncbi:hypothetical protein CD144_02205 [Staphylococcus equorum subsp. linens]|uniref:Uncharacterized protein n=1 Tax=Staphylococcus equorum TaxID=246432 RepID=A0AAP7IDQ1_9STAP|nr:hypothetical protein [Staphylococcus equorum]MDW4443378.1 hypothetical protein [Staphylococcus saprophyticus]MDK9844896.1 hypothetical protein [Staphylococcus equorum]MDK9853172.1 hypothetical protein [Staphylococcus equorum]MDW4477368.1 hypothetical protein [Staphylococcus saprophyticus]OEK55706.1 hypothetical protein ASS94_08885 [Staphylococcus equorum]